MMKISAAVGHIFLVLMLSALTVFGDVFYVSLSGNHTPPFNSWETAATNLHSALDLAAYGDEILVADGIHFISGPLIISQSITVRSEHGAGNCTIEGLDAFSAPQLSFGAQLEGFTLRNPYGCCLEASSALIRNCVFSDSNMADIRPGVTLENCDVNANVSLYCDSVVFTNCTVGGEGDFFPEVLPAQLFSQSSGPEQGTNTLRFCTLRNVEIDAMGDPDPKLLWHFEQCDLQGNVTIGAAPVSGNFHGNALLTLLYTIATNLTVTNFSPIYASNAQFWNCTLGGELDPFGMTPISLHSHISGPEQGTNTLRFCTLRNVEIDAMGDPDPKLLWHFEQCDLQDSVTIGAAPVSGQMTGNGMLSLLGTDLHHATISNLYQLICSDGASISNASISHSPGRGVILRDTARLSHSWISANQDGGVFCDGGGVVRNCLITDNQGVDGGGLLLNAGLVESCTIVGNIATSGGGIMSQADGEILNSIAWGNTAINGTNWWESGSPITWHHSCTAPLPTGSSNLATHPQLTSNYMLSASSPCIQAGETQSWMIGALDLADNPRIINQLVDIGAFEYIHSSEDADGDGMSDTDEITAGSDPADTNSFFGLINPGGITNNMLDDTGMVLSWYSATNRTYQIRRAEELRTGFNTLIAQNLPATPPLNTYTDTTASVLSGAYYRIEIKP